jgi:predicted Zn-dependent protease
MKNLIRLKSSAIALAVLLTLCWSVPAQAISYKEEDKLAREFMKYLEKQYEFITDPVIVQYVNAVGQKILAAMPPQPFEYHFYVIKEDSYNAFAIPAGHIFIHSGLLAAMDNEDELAGILGHEIAHVVCRHLSKRIERSKKIDLATLAGIVAGVFMGITTGDATAMQALTFGSAAAGQSAALAYSRDDEAQADQLGLQNITKAGYNPEGLLDALKIIRSKQWFGSQQIPTYMMTHPALEDRLVWIDGWMASHANLIKAPKPVPSEAFKRIKIRLRALYGNPNDAVQEFAQELDKHRDDADLIYGYGLALAQAGKRTEAETQLQRVLARKALDPFILTDLGRIYFLDGQYEKAINTLEGAVSISKENSEGLFYLGRARMELGQLQAAAEAFETLLQKDEDYQQAYYFLGETSGRLNDMADAHYYLGLYYYKKGDNRNARYHLEKSRQMLHDPIKLENVKKALDAMHPASGEKHPG